MVCHEKIIHVSCKRWTLIREYCLKTAPSRLGSKSADSARRKSLPISDSVPRPPYDCGQSQNFLTSVRSNYVSTDGRKYAGSSPFPTPIIHLLNSGQGGNTPFCSSSVYVQECYSSLQNNSISGSRLHLSLGPSWRTALSHRTAAATTLISRGCTSAELTLSGVVANRPGHVEHW